MIKRIAAVIMVVGLLGGSSAAVARTPPDKGKCKSSHCKAKHKGNAGHENRSPGAGH